MNLSQTGSRKLHHNFLFDLDQTLLDFHASERKALEIILRSNGLSFSEEICQAFKEYNKTLWLELEKGRITRPELFMKRFRYVFSQCEGNSAGLDPLIRMAVGHYQFESIHPFPDGNGRTGRLLCILFLMQEGLLQQPILYLSGAIVRDKAAYYNAIEGVRETGDFEPLLLYFLDAIRQTADWTAGRIRLIVQLMAETKDQLRAMGGGIYSHELINVLFRLPYCRIRNLVEAEVAKAQTAGRYLHALANAGLLREIPFGREKLYLNWRLYDILCGGRVSLHDS